MMKWLAVLGLLLIGTQAFAAVYTETFDDPLGEWRNRWLAQNSNMQNYYVCTGGGDENYRGNNPCGIWICDGTPDGESHINFEPTFGASITHLEFGIQSFTGGTLHVFDKDGNEIYTTSLTIDYSSPYGCYCTLYSVDSGNGVGGFSLLGGSIEGNTAVDDFTVITGETPVEAKTWGGIKAMFR